MVIQCSWDSIVVPSLVLLQCKVQGQHYRELTTISVCTVLREMYSEWPESGTTYMYDDKWRPG